MIATWTRVGQPVRTGGLTSAILQVRTEGPPQRLFRCVAVPSDEFGAVVGEPIAIVDCAGGTPGLHVAALRGPVPPFTSLFVEFGGRSELHGPVGEGIAFEAKLIAPDVPPESVAVRPESP